MKSIVVDSGPLVAYFDPGDRAHGQLRRWMAANSGRFRFVTSCSVVTEVTHLLGFDISTQTRFLRWATRGAMEVRETPQSAYPSISEMMDRYSNVPMDFADATVLHVAAEEGTDRVLSLDFRGFRTFRLPNGKRPTLELTEALRQ